jgi:hypothetical protein
MGAVKRAKPDIVALSSYVEAGRPVKVKDPFKSVTRVLLERPFLDNWMLAPGTGAPVASLTLPVMAPRDDWAPGVSVNPSRHTAAASVTTRIFGLLDCAAHGAASPHAALDTRRGRTA